MIKGRFFSHPPCLDTLDKVSEVIDGLLCSDILINVDEKEETAAGSHFQERQSRRLARQVDMECFDEEEDVYVKETQLSVL
jgi:hypothetical protein